MENMNKGGFGRRNEDRRDYGDKTFNNDGARPRRPRISKPRPSGERMFSSNDERRFIPAGEHRDFGSRREFGERREGSRRSFGENRRNFGDTGDRRRSFGEYHDRRRNFGEGNDNRRNFGEHGDRFRSFGEHNDIRRNSGEHEDRKRSGQYGKPYGTRKAAGPARKPAGRRPGTKPYTGAGTVTASQKGINRMIDRKLKQSEEAFSDFDYAPVPVKDEVRLNKFIANSGVCSRREADNFILAGVVTVNGEVVTELGTKVNINDDIRFNGERLKGEQKVYIVMNKPKGYVTTTSDPHAEKTVMDLLKGCKSRVFSVGRLDKSTTGVLMFTNDGEMAEKLTHPSYNKKKIYQVTLNEDLAKADYEKILSGVTLTDGEIAADELEYIDDSDHRKIGIEIHSGKNRIVRRIFESLGYDVKGLDRVYFAGLTKKGLKKGQWRYLTDGEINVLKIGSYQ